LTCNAKLDVVLLLDGSGSLGNAGWKAEIKAAQLLVDAFSSTGAQAKLAVTLYSGPGTWRGVARCTGKDNKGRRFQMNPRRSKYQNGLTAANFQLHPEVDMETDCNIKTVDHFTFDTKKVKDDLGELVFPRGSTLTSLALMNAYTEISLGRSDAKSIVIAITDGKPLYSGATKEAARLLRTKARLVWVPVTRNAPLWRIKKWATRRWQENVVEVKTIEDLEKPDVVTHVIANICPKPEAAWAQQLTAHDARKENQGADSNNAAAAQAYQGGIRVAR